MRTADGRDIIFSSDNAIRALFDQESTSDLILTVDGRRFYCHRVVLAPSCDFLLRCLKWPRSDTNTKPCFAVTLPDIEVPKPFKNENRASKAIWFEMFLNIIYGLYQLNKNNLHEVFVMAQIANYVVCEPMSKLCDGMLSAIRYSPYTVIDVAVFSQKWSLSNTIQSTTQFIAANFQLEAIHSNPKLYKMEIRDFRDLMKLRMSSKSWQLFAVYSYAIGKPPNSGFSIFTLCSDLIPRDTKSAIQTEELRKMFQEVLCEISLAWNRDDLKRIAGLCSKLFNENLFGGVAADQAFFYKILYDAYHRLHQHCH